MQDIEKIYEECFETVYKYLFCLTHNSDLAEELTQETFYRAVQKIDSFKGKCKISVWLCQIAKYLWYDELKKEKKFSKASEEELGFIASSENLEEMIVSNEKKISLYQKMQKLDDLTREVIYLRIKGDFSFKEIGRYYKEMKNGLELLFIGEN